MSQVAEVSNERMARSWAWAFFVALSALVLLEDYIPEVYAGTVMVKALYRVALVLPIAFWAMYQCRIYNIKHEQSYMALAAVIPEIAIPVLVVKSRGWKAAFRWVLATLLGFVCTLVIITLASVIADAAHKNA